MATPDPGAQGTPVGSPYGPPSGQHDQRLVLSGGFQPAAQVCHGNGNGVPGWFNWLGWWLRQRQLLLMHAGQLRKLALRMLEVN